MARKKRSLPPEKENDDTDVLVSLVETVASTFSRPISWGDDGQPPLALGYSLVLLLLAGAFLVPWPTFVLWWIGFGGYAWLGRTLVVPGDEDIEEEEEEEEEPFLSTDLLALGASAVTAGILTPTGSSSSSTLVGTILVNNFSNNNNNTNEPFNGILVLMGTVLVAASIAAAIGQGRSLIDENRNFDVDSFIDEEDGDSDSACDSSETKLMNLWDETFRKTTTKEHSNDEDNEPYGGG